MLHAPIIASPMPCWSSHHESLQHFDRTSAGACYKLSLLEYGQWLELIRLGMDKLQAKDQRSNLHTDLQKTKSEPAPQQQQSRKPKADSSAQPANTSLDLTKRVQRPKPFKKFGT